MSKRGFLKRKKYGRERYKSEMRKRRADILSRIAKKFADNFFSESPFLSSIRCLSGEHTVAGTGWMVPMIYGIPEYEHDRVIYEEPSLSL